MKKIYKVVMEYSHYDDVLCERMHHRCVELFNSKKAACKFIDYLENSKYFANYERASAEVYDLEADFRGCFYDGPASQPILKFSFTHKAMAY